MKKVRTTQLILDGMALPYVSGDRYSAHPATLSRQVEMISGRVVSEERGKVWRITYSADYIDEHLRADELVSVVGQEGCRERRAALAQRGVHAAGGEAA